MLLCEEDAQLDYATSSISDVLLDGGGEEYGLLADDAQGSAPQPLAVHLPHVYTVYCNLACVYVVEPGRYRHLFLFFSLLGYEKLTSLNSMSPWNSWYRITFEPELSITGFLLMYWNCNEDYIYLNNYTKYSLTCDCASRESFLSKDPMNVPPMTTEGTHSSLSIQYIPIDKLAGPLLVKECDVLPEYGLKELLLHLCSHSLPHLATSLSAGVLMLSMKSAVGFDLWFANTFTTSPNTADIGKIRQKNSSKKKEESRISSTEHINITLHINYVLKIEIFKIYFLVPTSARRPLPPSVTPHAAVGRLSSITAIIFSYDIPFKKKIKHNDAMIQVTTDLYHHRSDQISTDQKKTINEQTDLQLDGVWLPSPLVVSDDVADDGATCSLGP
uniref:SFRICE_002696 n=1 Tax=Spodoptera frugiperda TaxID=7108 RepID=A0A2H1VIU5_SPOFR